MPGLKPLQDEGSTDNRQAVDYDADLYCFVSAYINGDGTQTCLDPLAYSAEKGNRLPLPFQAKQQQYTGDVCKTEYNKVMIDDECSVIQ